MTLAKAIRSWWWTREKHPVSDAILVIRRPWWLSMFKKNKTIQLRFLRNLGGPEVKKYMVVHYN